MRKEPSTRRPSSHVVSIKRAAGGRRQGSRKIVDEKKEKYKAKNRSLRNTSTDSKGATFVILKNYASAPISKEELSSTSRARREASRSQFVKKGGMPDRVEILGEVDRSNNRPRARLGFVKSIRNGLKKVENLIQSRPARAEGKPASVLNGVITTSKELWDRRNH